MKNLFLFVSLTFLLSSCSTLRPGVVQFSESPSEIFTKSSLKEYLRTNQNPKIVLRVPDSAKDATTEERYSKTEVYNSIEKELLKSGFDVRDRGLFNEILRKTETSDYSKIRELTDTELILELVSLNTNVEYHTNKYYTPGKRKEKKLYQGNITLYGASTEFKLILVKTNEIAGTYQFNYAPCTQGCEYQIDASGKVYRRRSGKLSEVPDYEFVETDLLVEFMKKSTQELIKNMK